MLGTPRSVHRFGIFCSQLFAISSLAVSCQVVAADWPRFLGPTANGIVRDTGKLVDAFPPAGPKEVWRVEGGAGQSGFAIVEDHCLTMMLAGKQQVLVALNAKTGETLWQTVVGPNYENSMGGHGPRATPTVSGKEVLAYTGEGILVSADWKTGKVRWSQNLPESLNIKPAEYGMACSPLVVGDAVVVTVGAPVATLAAFQRETGKRLWNTGTSTAGYSTPALLKIAGQEQIVAVAGKQVLAVQPTSGEILWSYPFVTDYDCNSASPIEVAGDVLVSAGENHGSVRLRVTEVDGKTTVSEVWESLGGQSVLRSEWQTPLQIDGYIYGFDNVGSAGAVTHLSCVAAKTGELAWKKTRFGKGNAIFADGKMIAANMKGELILGKLSPAGYQELARAQVIDGTRQAPALADGKVFLRDNRQFVCIDLSR